MSKFYRSFAVVLIFAVIAFVTVGLATVGIFTHETFETVLLMALPPMIAGGVMMLKSSFDEFLDGE